MLLNIGNDDHDYNHDHYHYHDHNHDHDHDITTIFSMHGSHVTMTTTTIATNERQDDKAIALITILTRPQPDNVDKGDDNGDTDDNGVTIVAVRRK